MESYVLTVIGADRAGLVEALSRVVADHGGSWERSHMTELAGMFAGVVLVHVPAERAGGFTTDLAPLREQGLLEVTLRPAAGADEDGPATTLAFEVVGADRPGIVHEVSAALAGLGVGIVDLRTATESAAMAGELLFRASAQVRVPHGVTTDDVVDALERLADDLMVDVQRS